MSERRDRLDPAAIEAALLDLAAAIELPRASSELAAAVSRRIGERPAPARRSWWPARPLRRALLVAIALALVVAAVAGAIGLGLPGLRIVLGPPPSLAPTPSPSVSAGTVPGATLGLGTQVPVDDIGGKAAFPVRLPTDPAVGRPDAAWLDTAKAGQVTLVWATRPALPATLSPGIGLLLAEFDGRLDEGFVTKTAGGGTRIENVTVGGMRGYWLTGAPHFYFYTAASGEFVEDDRRWVGDALLWSKDGVTYRLETSLGREATIRIAESLR